MKIVYLIVINLETTPTYGLLMEVIGIEGVTWFDYTPSVEDLNYVLEVN